MFLGTHTPKLDEKGRLILPAKYRDELSDGLVITRFQERCLAIWPRAVFVEVAQTVRSASSSQQHVRDYQRMLASGASDETPDKQGRVTIPPHLRAGAATRGLRAVGHHVRRRPAVGIRGGTRGGTRLVGHADSP